VTTLAKIDANRRNAELSTGPRTEVGKALVADEPLARIARGDRAGAVSALYGGALDALVATRAVAAASDVASLAVFPTSRRAQELPALRDRLRALPEPCLLLGADAAPSYGSSSTAVVLGSCS
jgi:hypothetical protein